MFNLDRSTGRSVLGIQRISTKCVKWLFRSAVRVTKTYSSDFISHVSPTVSDSNGALTLNNLETTIDNSKLVPSAYTFC